MNLSSFEELRKIILTNFSIQSLVQPEYHSFFESAYVPICAFSISNTPLSWNAKFFDLSDFYGEKIKLQIFSMQLKMTINVIGNITESPRTFYVLPDISLLTLCLILRYLASKHPKTS